MRKYIQRKNIMRGLLVSFFFVLPLGVWAQNELVPDTVTVMKAEVVAIESEEVRDIPGTDVRAPIQTIKVKILDGAEKGREVVIENDYLILEEGEVFYITHTVDRISDMEYYAVNDPYRLPQIFFLVGLFVVCVFFFGGLQGIRGLVSLIGSFLLIFYVLLPGVLQGYSPLLVAVGVSSLIIVVGSYITHGFTKTTTSAVVGMVITVSFTGLLAYWSVYITRLSGFGSEEAIYLNLNARGAIDVVGILLGGIIIGLLGVLYDAAIGQAVSVEELAKIAPHASKKTIYQRAIRIGREHIGALVNTLAIAYVGAALPLLLLFYQSSNASIWFIINTEIFSTEIIRIMIGSIGLVLAVPITTIVSVWILMRTQTGTVSEDVVRKEEERLLHVGHHH